MPLGERVDFIFNKGIVHWASCFIRVQVGEWKVCLSTTKGGVILSASSHSKSKILSAFLHYLLKINAAGHFLTGNLPLTESCL